MPCVVEGEEERLALREEECVLKDMAPSIDCIASLYCAEDVTGGEWDDEEQESGQIEVQRLTTDFLQPIVFLDFPVEDDDAIAVLLQKESRYMPEADYPGRYRSRDLNAGARQNAISWMLKVSFSGFLHLISLQRCRDFSLFVLASLSVILCPVMIDILP